MSTRKRGLGRNLDALLGGTDHLAVAEPERESELRHIAVDLIQRGKYQPRREMNKEALEELAASIRAQGIIQPIVLRSVAGNRYEIIAGERRWRAAQLAGLSAVPALVREIPDEAAIAVALIENIQREDLNPIEEAKALQRLGEEFSLTHQQIAETVGRSRAGVSNLLRLLSLDAEVQIMLEQGEIEMGHARALLSLEATKQRHYASVVAEQGLSVRETEKLIQRLHGGATKTKKTQIIKDPDIDRLEQSLAEKIGAPVVLQYSAKGKGKLTIYYNSLDELDGVLEHIS